MAQEFAQYLHGLTQVAQMTFRTPAEVRAITQHLKVSCPLSWGQAEALFELALNAVEHGNLAFDAAQKKHYLENGCWAAMVDQRLTSEPWCHRQATLVVFRASAGTGAAPPLPPTYKQAFLICDQGQGFDWRAWLPALRNIILPAAEDAAAPCGRGLLLAAQLSKTTPHFNAKGNAVLLSLVPHS